MDIRECLPKSANFLSFVSINGQTCEVHMTRRSVYIIIGRSLYRRNTKQIVENNLRRDLVRSSVTDLCRECIADPGSHLVINLQ